MRNILLLEVLEGNYELGSVELDYFLFETIVAMLFNEFFESAVRYVFKHKIEVLFVSKGVIHVWEEGALLAFNQDVALPEDTLHFGPLDEEVP